MLRGMQRMKFVLLGCLLASAPACGAEEAAEAPAPIAPVLPGTPSGTTPVANPNVAPPANGAGNVARCHTPSMSMCMECQLGMPCESPTMQQSCTSRPGTEFSNTPCPTANAFAECQRTNGMRIVYYAGPPRNLTEQTTRGICDNAMHGTYRLL